MLTYREALTRAADQLSAHPLLRDNAFRDAVELFMHSMAISRASLMAHPERRIDREQQAAYQRLIERRLRFEPIQYILGHTEFYGLTLRVSPAVLIPRPETELLVEAMLARLPHDQPVRIADIGTGSGAIAIAIAHALPQASVTALDLSPQALALARENAQTHSLEARIRFLESDLLAAVSQEEPFDAIVSNPPYVPLEDAPTLHPQVREHEPLLALYAGDDGLELYRRIIPEALALLKQEGLLALEIGHGQRDAVAELLTDWHEVVFLDDLQQIPRVVVARKP